MPQAQKVAAHRPTDFVDACYTAADAKITNMDRCAELFPIASDARIVAGAPLANDVRKCTLKPVDPDDYLVSLSVEQLGALQRIFPEGVCDWSRPGVGQVPLAGTWAFYTGNAEVRYPEARHSGINVRTPLRDNSAQVVPVAARPGPDATDTY